MWYYILKIAVTVVLVVAVSEAAKRSSFVGGLVASIPLVSLLAMIWLYVESREIGKVIEFSHSVFWLVIPSLMLFVSLPLLLKAGIGFYMSLLMATALTVGAYFAVILLLRNIGITL